MKPEHAYGLENAGWPALLLDAAGKICRANPAAVALFGPVLQGEAPSLSALWSPENGLSAEQFLGKWELAPTPSTVLKFRTKGGNTAALTVFICSLNRGEEKEFIMQWLPESPLARGETHAPEGDEEKAIKHKLECALQLAQTVALDFNNALTGILGHTTHILSQMEPGHPWRNSLLEVEKSAARAAEVATDLGTFSQPDKAVRSQALENLNPLLRRTIESLQQSAAHARAEWQLRLEPRLFAADFDEAKMQQAFARVLENALQSLAGGGRVTVQTHNLVVKEPMEDGRAVLAPGVYVCAEITDTGCGIAPEALPRVFEPFFTTKQGHRGLGLAWVYGIVTNHGGGVAVSSQPGAGTSVRVYLPAENRIAKDSAVPAAALAGEGTILMVDDEELLLTMGRTVLSANGYQVVTANSGFKALEILLANETPVDLVITDLVMPTMGGRELAEHIRLHFPELRVLCTSGAVGGAEQVKDLAYLQKPFSSQELLLHVKELLSNPGASGPAPQSSR